MHAHIYDNARSVPVVPSFTPMRDDLESIDTQ